MSIINWLKSFKIENKKNKLNLDYQKNLIKELKNEHKAVVKLLGSVYQELQLEKQNDKKIKKHLKSIEDALLSHFMKEDIKLYWYLNKAYRSDDVKYRTIKSFEDSMRRIQQDILKFFNYYSNPINILDQNFKNKLDDMVEKLSDRIKMEEKSLYSLYVKI